MAARKPNTNRSALKAKSTRPMEFIIVLPRRWRDGTKALSIFKASGKVADRKKTKARVTKPRVRGQAMKDGSLMRTFFLQYWFVTKAIP